MLGDILTWFPFARGAGDTEDAALLLSSRAGSGDGTPRHVGRDGERLGCRVEVPGGSWSQFLEDESVLQGRGTTCRENPGGWRSLWVHLCDPQQLIQLHSRH